MLSTLLIAFAAVFGAEIAGDKLIYTAGILSSRYRTAPMLCGIVAALMVKMGVAVAAGAAITSLPPVLIALSTAASLAWLGRQLWAHTTPSRPQHDATATEAVSVSFTTVSFAEWGDIGQITAAAITAELGHPLIVWMGAVLAMTAKGLLAVAFGARVTAALRARVSPRLMRAATVTLVVVVGLWSIVETFNRH